MIKVKRIKHLRRKSAISQLIIRVMMMMTRTKRDVSIATVLIIQQKIADMFTQKRQMTNFESNISLKNRVKQP
jgi:hypothetical protein